MRYDVSLIDILFAGATATFGGGQVGGTDVGLAGKSFDLHAVIW